MFVLIRIMVLPINNAIIIRNGETKSIILIIKQVI